MRVDSRQTSKGTFHWLVMECLIARLAHCTTRDDQGRLASLYGHGHEIVVRDYLNSRPFCMGFSHSAGVRVSWGTKRGNDPAIGGCELDNFFESLATSHLLNTYLRVEHMVKNGQYCARNPDSLKPWTLPHICLSSQTVLHLALFMIIGLGSGLLKIHRKEGGFISIWKKYYNL